MSDKKDAKINGAEEVNQAKSLPVVVHTQYIKDVSFENPGAPESLRAGLDAPKIDLNIGLDARAIDDDEIKSLYEVVLTLTAEASRDKPVFLAEIQYGGVVSMGDVPENQHHPMALIEIPKLLFPYARQALSDLTAQGGYPPLLINPVDFAAMYMDRFKDVILQPGEKEHNAKAAKG